MLSRIEVEKLHEGYKEPWWLRLMRTREFDDAAEEMDAAITKAEQLMLFDGEDYAA